MNQRTSLLLKIDQLQKEKKDFPNRAEEIEQKMQAIGEQLINLTNEKRSAKLKDQSKPVRRKRKMPYKRISQSQKDQAIQLLKTTDMKIVDIAKKTSLGESTIYKLQKELREGKKAPASKNKTTKKLSTPKRTTASAAMQKRINELEYERNKMKDNWKEEQDKALQLEEDLDKANRIIKQLEADLGDQEQNNNFEKAYNRLKHLHDELKESKTLLVQENDKIKRQLDDARRLSAYHKQELERARGLQVTIDKQDSKIQKLEQILMTYMGERYELDQDIRSASDVG